MALLGSALRSAIVLIAILTQLSIANALSKGTSHIGITKTTSLQIANMDASQFNFNKSSHKMSSNACLRTGGEPVPFRISAISLNGNNSFAATNDDRQSNIGYEVIWSAHDDQFRMNNSADLSEVIQADAGVGCSNHTFAIEMDASTFANASTVTHTDTLSLIFVIE